MISSIVTRLRNRLNKRKSTPTLSKYLGTWGHYPWTPTNGEEFIHPDDHQAVRLNPATFSSRGFYCSGETEDGYLVLNFANKQYHVKPDLYRVMPNVIPFKHGDTVRYKAKPERIGTIAGFIWHVKRGEPFYYLMIDGKMAKKRYYVEDIELITDEGN